MASEPQTEVAGSEHQGRGNHGVGRAAAGAPGSDAPHAPLSPYGRSRPFLRPPRRHPAPRSLTRRHTRPPGALTPSYSSPPTREPARGPPQAKGTPDQCSPPLRCRTPGLSAYSLPRSPRGSRSQTHSCMNPPPSPPHPRSAGSHFPRS